MVVHAYFPLAETRVQRQAETLVAHGYEVDIICLRHLNSAPEEVVRGVKVYRLPVRRIYGHNLSGQFLAYLHFFIMALLKLISLQQRRAYGVIQVHNLPDILVFCALWPKLAGAKIILDIHDVMPEFMAERIGQPITSWPVKWMIWQEQLACHFADHVITVTEPWRQALIGRGVPAAKTSVVMNVADPQFFHRRVREQAGVVPANDSFRLIYHGIQASRHGLDTLLHAIAQVRPHIPNLHLTLHGRGAYQSTLMRLTESLALTNCVQFETTYLPLAELPCFVAQNDVGVVPYYDDIFTGGILPTKLLEYIALGLPVIAARTPAITTYFDETMVYFFEPGNAADLAAGILTLYQNQPRREALVRHSEHFQEQYNWTHLSLDYVALIDRLNQRRIS